MRKKIRRSNIAAVLGLIAMVVSGSELSFGEDVKTIEENVSAKSEASTRKKTEITGGPCGYEKQIGVCYFSYKKRGGPVSFKFIGKVDGRDVIFENNEASETFNPGDEVFCSIQFIIDGTCTPCGFDLNGTWGSCGKDAWDFYRNRQMAPDFLVENPGK